VKNWKRRWFVLDSHDVLRYYRNPENTKPAGLARCHILLNPSLCC
jgi:hypothetical protein